MRSIAIICVAALVCGCVLPNIPYDGTTRSTFISEEGQNRFAIFVYPRTAPQDVAIEAALEKAHPFCEQSYGTSKVELLSLEDGTFAVPSEWYIKGRCVRSVS